MDRQRKREMEAEKQEARKQRMESAKIASSPAQVFPQLPVFSPPKKNVTNTNDPLKARAQSVLGQFEDARPLINEQSSVGVPLTPMTPIGIPYAGSSSKLSDKNLFNPAVLQSRSTYANQGSYSPHSQAVGRTSNGAKERIGVNRHMNAKGDRCVGSNNVTSSSDSLIRCVVDSSSAAVSDKAKLMIKIPPDDTINQILKEMCLPAELSAIGDTPTKFCAPAFPALVEQDNSPTSDSDSDGDPLLVFQNVSPSNSLSSTNSVEQDPLEAAVLPSAVVLKSDSEDENSSGQVSDSESSESDEESSLLSGSQTSTPVNTVVPGLGQADGRPSVVVKLPLPPHLRKNAKKSPLNFDNQQMQSHLPRPEASTVPTTITAAAKGSKLARDTIAKIMGENAHLPTAIKIPKKKSDALPLQASASQRSHKSIHDDDSQHRPEDHHRYSNSPAPRYGSPSLRRDSPKSVSRRNASSNRYTDFDQPPLSEDIESPYSAPYLETFGVPVPVIQDPYADFVPKSSDEENVDAANDSARAPDIKRRCKEIGDIWSAGLVQDNKKSQYGGKSRYSREVDVDRASNYSNHSGRRRDERYNRERDRTSNRNDRHATRRRRRSENAEETNNRRFPKYSRGEVSQCDRGVSTSPQRRPNEIMLCDRSCGRTPVHYEDDEVQTDAVEEPCTVVSTDAGRSRQLSIIGDNLQKEYNSKLLSPEYYFAEAKKMKRTADQEKDLCLRSLLYLESVLLYAEHIYCLQRKLTDKVRLYKTYLDTYTMCTHNNSSRLKNKITVSLKWHIVDSLSFRVQSYLREQMWQLKQSECQRSKDVVNSYTKDKIGANGEVSSVKSDSGSSEDFAPNAVPLDVMSSVQDYMNGVDNLVASTMLWSKADALISMHCKDFFACLSSEVGDITRECHLCALITYVRAGLDRVRAL